MKINSHTFEYKGHTITIDIHYDEYNGAPWEEHDGHGSVSEWRRHDAGMERSDKAPGELVLVQDGRSARFYDFAGAMQIAKRDGWGIDEKRKAELARKLGRPPTAGEIRHAAVMQDFEYLRGWANNEWHWLGYTSTITSPDGEIIDSDSCWGYDDHEYMITEASGNLRAEVERMITTAMESQHAENCP